MTGHEGADAIKDEALRQIGEMQGWVDAVLAQDAAVGDVPKHLRQRLQDTRDRFGSTARAVVYQHECIVCAIKAQDYGEASKRHRDLEAEANMVKRIYRGVIDLMREIGVVK